MAQSRMRVFENAIAYLEQRGIELEIFLYLKEKPGKSAVKDLLGPLGLKASELLGPNEGLAEEMGLYDGASEAAILDAMAANAALIQRPIVITTKGAMIARPKTRIDEIL